MKFCGLFINQDFRANTTYVLRKRVGSCHTGNRFICYGELGIFVKVSTLSMAMTLTYSLPGNRCSLWVSYNIIIMILDGMK